MTAEPLADHHAAEAASGLWGLALARIILAALRRRPPLAVAAEPVRA